MTFEKHCEESIRLFEDSFHPSVINPISTRAKKMKFMTMEPASIKPRSVSLPQVIRMSNHYALCPSEGCGTGRPNLTLRRSYVP
jgi:hypothetical protein